MDMLTLLAATSPEEDRGWGGPIALLIGLAAFIALTRGPRWIGGWLDRRAAARDELDDDEGLDDDEPEQPAPRWLALARSIRDALWERTPLPSPAGGQDHAGGITEVSVGSDPTGDPGQGWAADPSDDPTIHGEIVEDDLGRRYRRYRPGEAPMRSALATERTPAGPETPDRHAARRIAEGAIGPDGQGYRVLLREVMRVHDVSESSAKRAIRRARVAHDAQ